MAPGDPPREPSGNSWKILSGAAGALLLASIIRHGWLSDDSFVSFRAIANLLAGWGPVFNPGERVQGFTNPLWTTLLVLPYWLTRDIYGTAMVVSFLCCLVAGVMVWRRFRAGWQTAWVFTVLSASMAFVSFSTSGLENPLSYLLLTALFVASTGPAVRPWLVWLLGALIVTNRLDHGLLVAPMLVSTLARAPRAQWWKPLLATLPIAAWLLFALVYYGFPAPNTAYAKLNVSIPRAAIVAQGLSYVVDSLLSDPVVVLVIVLASVTVLASRRLSHPLALHGLGIAAYVGYVCWIGGDFMSGRFLVAPFLMAVLVASHLFSEPRTAFALAGLALLVGHRVLLPLPNEQAASCNVPPSGIVDERVCFIDYMGIAQNVRTKKFRTHPWFRDGEKAAEEKKRVVVANTIGMLGFGAGTTVHIVDPYALTDPLLARIKFKATGNWRPGHLERPLPAGYVESVEQRRNLLVDPCARGLLDDLWLITRGPLFSAARWRAIARRNLHDGTCS
jgi:arabinofuranosyltransferase